MYRTNELIESTITDQLMLEIDGIISSITYTINVMVVADGIQRSEVDSVSQQVGTVVIANS